MLVKEKYIKAVGYLGLHWKKLVADLKVGVPLQLGEQPGPSILGLLAERIPRQHFAPLSKVFHLPNPPATARVHGTSKSTFPNTKTLVREISNLLEY